MSHLSRLLGFVLVVASTQAAIAQTQEKTDKESPVKQEVAEDKATAPETVNFIITNDDEGAPGHRVISRPVESVKQTVTIQTPAGKRSQTRYILDPLLHNFGLSLVEADDVLRAQLEIPNGEGVVVMTIKPESLADQAGLKPKDILLSLRGTPAKNVADVKKVLLGLNREAIPVKLIRQGKPFQLSVVGPEHGLPIEPTDYWIGVPVTPVDATLRAHLPNLAEQVGLVANDVVKDSPAEAAGLKKNDILVTFNGKPLKDSEGMIALIQASEGKSVPVEILRAGKPLILNIMPAKRPKVARFQTAVQGNQPSQVFFQEAFFGPNVAVEIKPDGNKQAVPGMTGATATVDVQVLNGEKKGLEEAMGLLEKNIKDQIQLKLSTIPNKLTAENPTASVKAELKEISIKLDEILKELKKPEKK
jgi:membrane-associated protease RseP (regulator of RpoE activity)